MRKKTLIIRMLYWMRNLRSGALFRALRCHSRGSVLDVGGWDFYSTAVKQRVPFHTWTVLEMSDVRPAGAFDRRMRFVVGDGCHLGFRDECFDTVLNIQVLEHSFEPLLMINEMCRVLKDKGVLIAMLPQTATIHIAPHHYYNFTRFFIEEALRRNSMRIVELIPLGGTWSSIASRLFFFVLQSARFPGMSTEACRRNLLFYLLFPFMVIFVGVALPLCLLFSLGDLTEEPNNHLVVAHKEQSAARNDRQECSPLDDFESGGSAS